MQVTNPNDVKIYNLSAGKSLPEWISERRRRALQKSDIEIQRRIQLLQDFEMPTASMRVKVSPDGQYIMAAGTYKPRLRCFDVNQLSMKFERCLDADVQQFQILSNDYTKVVLMLANRVIQLHSQNGYYYQTRIPTFGRDMAYHYPSCDLYMVGASCDVYRLNLEQGCFLSSYATEATSLNVCRLNQEHQLLAVGSDDGKIECWDPRSRSRVGQLDVTMATNLLQTEDISVLPAVTALQFRDALTMAVGTASGQVLLYDIRSNQPFLTKDHYYGLPIKSIEFQDDLGVVLSADTRILKIWDRNSGTPVTAIEPQSDIHDICVYPSSGLIFMANEGEKILSYYIPTLGPAPKWCSFLDSLTEELEENPQQEVYEDYKFVTAKDLESLGLSHLIGTNLLRAYMHGYFMDIRLYHKAKSLSDPFAYEEYRRSKIQKKLEEQRANRVQAKKLPKVNRMLAERLVGSQRQPAKKRTTQNPLDDARFSEMFTNPNFQVDEESEEYKLLHPVISKQEKKRLRELEEEKQVEQQRQLDEELEGMVSEEETSTDEDNEGDDSDPPSFSKPPGKSKNEMSGSRLGNRYGNHRGNQSKFELKTKMRLIEASDKAVSASFQPFLSTTTKLALGERLKEGENQGDDTVLRVGESLSGNKTVVFKFKKTARESVYQRKLREHGEERRKLRRSARPVAPDRRKMRGVFWRGRRIR
ncbi:nucleolar protein 10-like [Corticium candelabrum]|uniref:nucleolar protein 10-like n=1 Tax=Corticium candelabrum TaxID=121492 RepID=UPI002E27308E|nr:nucleolar protein 10-like [Corticium candelabrum]